MWEMTFEDYLHDTNVLDELSLLRMIPLIIYIALSWRICVTY